MPLIYTARNLVFHPESSPPKKKKNYKCDRSGVFTLQDKTDSAAENIPKRLKHDPEAEKDDDQKQEMVRGEHDEWINTSLWA